MKAEVACDPGLDFEKMTHTPTNTQLLKIFTGAF